MSFLLGVRTVIALPIVLLASLVKMVSLISLLRRWNSPLSEIPGPRLASWTRLWWIKVLYSGQADAELVKLHKKYGSIVRIGPKTVVVSDPETTRRILAVGSRFTRGPWFDSLRLDPDQTTVVSERDPKKHQELRYVLSAGLSGKDICSVETIVDDHIQGWMRILNTKQSTFDEKVVKVDLSQAIPFLTLDIIAHLCLGASFRCLETDTDQYGFLDALQTGMIAQPYLGSLLELKKLLFTVGRPAFIRSRLFPNANNPKGLGRVMQFIREIVERRMAQGPRNEAKVDMLDSFFARGLSPDQATSELLVVLSSGVGATAYAIQGIIRCVIENPNAQRKLQQDIDHVVSSENCGPRDVVNESVIKRMSYLQACITEGLRLYPPVSLLRERVVPPEGDYMHGYRIPGGTFIGLNGPASKLHPVYGSDVEDFRPERWLINDETQLKQMARNMELVFGYGASKCLGVNLAYTELNKIIFELFRNHDLRLADPEHPWKARGDFILSDFHVVASRRN
ncbi:cytochrome P450 [Lophiotrema nucula]|uniref:Cytochrome P450 n=1 Tax=Lophiotrema nucula TaxID=690887 RepID=A0A6A5Z8X1_9PLEO|nr:cytochrome P450 [Lophiotrema nucula]